jgi:hypothetical protein
MLALYSYAAELHLLRTSGRRGEFTGYGVSVSLTRQVSTMSESTEPLLRI